MQEIKLLNGSRFSEESNLVYRVPKGELPTKTITMPDGTTVEWIDFDHSDTKKILIDFIRHHHNTQQPRLEELKRYYKTDNNIKYREKKRDEYRADNRIASDFAKFIVTFNRGVVIGNPIEYSGEGFAIDELLTFSQESNERYHNQRMCTDIEVYGRAYELIYRNEKSDERVARLDPLESFVVYDETVEQNSLFGVRYFDHKYLGRVKSTVEVYTNDGRTLIFRCENQDYEKMKLDAGDQYNYFNGVVINEWQNNDDRMGDFESVMDNIDAYDISQSELANFQQDSSDAYLVIEGNPATGEEPGTDEDPRSISAQNEALKDMRDARILVLGEPTQSADGKFGPNPKAYYLVKEYDTEGAEAYKERLVADILRFANVVDYTDENIGGNNTGIGMRFKGWGNDNLRKTKEAQIEKAIRRRNRLLAQSWALSKGESDLDTLYEEVNKIGMLFTPNIPQSDTELITKVQGLDGIVSDATLFEIVKMLTGVKPETEMERIQSEGRKRREDALREIGYDSDKDVTDDD